MTLTDLCRDFLHHKCPGCPGCRCHTDEAIVTDTATYGEQHAIRPVFSRDLLSHLQSGRDALPLDQAARVVQTVIDLGWRPTVAQLLRDTPPGTTTPEPQADGCLPGCGGTWPGGREYHVRGCPSAVPGVRCPTTSGLPCRHAPEETR